MTDGAAPSDALPAEGGERPSAPSDIWEFREALINCETDEDYDRLVESLTASRAVPPKGDSGS